MNQFIYRSRKTAAYNFVTDVQAQWTRLYWQIRFSWCHNKWWYSSVDCL